MKNIISTPVLSLYIQDHMSKIGYVLTTSYQTGTTISESSP